VVLSLFSLSLSLFPLLFVVNQQFSSKILLLLLFSLLLKRRRRAGGTGGEEAEAVSQSVRREERREEEKAEERNGGAILLHSAATILQVAALTGKWSEEASRFDPPTLHPSHNLLLLCCCWVLLCGLDIAKKRSLARSVGSSIIARSPSLLAGWVIFESGQRSLLTAFGYLLEGRQTGRD
jgi:hypothetical protein